jgi:hypothetical protein
VGCLLAVRVVYFVPANRPTHAQLQILTISGQRLDGFFSDIGSDARIAKQLHTKLPQSQSCQSWPRFWEKVGNIIGLSTVVHAQGSCSTTQCAGCPYYAFAGTCTTNCDGTATYQRTSTDLHTSGTKQTGNLNCGGTVGCLCEVEDCDNSANCP